MGRVRAKANLPEGSGMGLDIWDVLVKGSKAEDGNARGTAPTSATTVLGTDREELGTESRTHGGS
jgi:hypothetical protein